MKMQSGFSLIEVMVSLVVFAIGVLGFLQLNTKSQRLLNKNLLQEQTLQAITQANEMLSQPMQRCPACQAVKQLKQQFVAHNELTFQQKGKHTIIITHCQAQNQCQSTSTTG